MAASGSSESRDNIGLELHEPEDLGAAPYNLIEINRAVGFRVVRLGAAAWSARYKLWI
jgi:hypothetical protein